MANLMTLEGHSNSVRVLVDLGDGRIASGSGDSSIKIWNIKNRKCTKTLFEEDSVGITTLANLGDGRLASGCHRDIKIWDIERGTSQRINIYGKNLENESLGVISLIYTGSDILVGGYSNKRIRIWNINTRKILNTITAHNGSINALLYLDNGNIISGSNEIKTWEFINRSSLRDAQRPFKGHTKKINALINLENGRIASASSDKAIKIWNTENGQCGNTLEGHNGEVTSLVNLRDGRIASGSSDGEIKIWNIETGICENTLSDNNGTVWSLLEIEEGILASGGSDGTIRIHHL